MDRKIIFTPEEHYHIFNRGIEKRKLFLEPGDHERFQAGLYLCNTEKPVTVREIKVVPYEYERGQTLVDILGYAMMPNHFHLLLHEKINNGISKFMAKLSTSYAMYFNTKHERVGALLCHPFRAKHVDNDDYFRWVFSYIHMNPIELIEPKWKESGIANRNKAEKWLQSYKYSSFPDYFEKERIQSRILSKESLPISVREFDGFDSLVTNFTPESPRPPRG